MRKPSQKKSGVSSEKEDPSVKELPKNAILAAVMKHSRKVRIVDLLRMDFPQMMEALKTGATLTEIHRAYPKLRPVADGVPYSSFARYFQKLKTEFEPKLVVKRPRKAAPAPASAGPAIPSSPAAPAPQAPAEAVERQAVAAAGPPATEASAMPQRAPAPQHPAAMAAPAVARPGRVPRAGVIPPLPGSTPSPVVFIPRLEPGRQYSADELETEMLAQRTAARARGEVIVQAVETRELARHAMPADAFLRIHGEDPPGYPACFAG